MRQAGVVGGGLRCPSYTLFCHFYSSIIQKINALVFLINTMTGDSDENPFEVIFFKPSLKLVVSETFLECRRRRNSGKFGAMTIAKNLQKSSASVLEQVESTNVLIREKKVLLSEAYCEQDLPSSSSCSITTCWKSRVMLQLSRTVIRTHFLISLFTCTPEVVSKIVMSLLRRPSRVATDFFCTMLILWAIVVSQMQLQISPRLKKF